MVLLRLGFISLLALLVGGCGKKANSGAARPRTEPIQAVEVTSITRRDLAETLSVVGSLAPNESAELRPEITGLVRGIFFEEGQAVKKGDLLMKIDDAELRAQYAQIEARYKLAELNVVRSENLSQAKTIPLSEYDRARSEFSATEAELAVLRLRLEKTEVRAPFDGVIGSRSISAGDYVTTTNVLTRIDDLSRLKIDFQVPERFLRKVQHGTRFVVQSSSLDASARVEGEVYFVSSVIDRNTRSSEVKGILEQPPRELRPGMFANIELVLEVREGALTVPEGSILTSSTGTQIVAVRASGTDQVAEFVPVRLGLRSRGFVEITPLQGSLAENQSVVASGVGSLILYPGAKLDPRPLKAEFIN